MRANLDITRGLVLAEAVIMRLAAAPRQERRARARRGGVPPRRRRGTLAARTSWRTIPRVTAVLDRGAIEAALSPENYLGCARTFVENALGRRGNA